MSPYAVGALALTWAASLVAVGAWQSNAGHVDEKAAWLGKQTVDLIAANEKIGELESKAREDEKAHGKRLFDISERLEKEKKDELEKRDRRIADLRAERLRLLDPGRKDSGRDSASGTTASPRQCDGQAGSILSIEASEFLLRLTGEADEVANQLTECQAVVMSDRGITAHNEGE